MTRQRSLTLWVIGLGLLVVGALAYTWFTAVQITRRYASQANAATLLQDQVARDLDRFQIVQAILIALCAGMAFFVVVLFRRYHRAQKRTLSSLQEATGRYRQVVEEAPMLICRFLPGGEITYANRRYCEYFGKTQDELAGETILSLIPQEEHETVLANIATMTVESPDQVHEHKVIGPGGEIRWHRWRNRARFNANGDPIAYQSIGVDITEQRAAQEQATRFSQVLNNSLDEIYIFHSETLRFLDANRGAIENLGYTLEELRNLTPVDLKPEFTRERFLEMLEPLRRGSAENIAFTTNHRRKNGALYPVDVHLQFIPGDTPAFLAIILDITKSRRAEEALRENEERRDLAMSVANDGVWDWNVVTDEVYVDRRYYTMAGYEPNEFPSRFEEWARRVHPEDFKEVEPTVRSYLAGETSRYDVTFRFRKKDGDWMWIRARGIIAARDTKGKPLRMIGTHSDITEQVRLGKEKSKLEEQYHLSQKLESIGRLAGGVAHDLNNLLLPILGYSEILLDDMKEEDPRRESMEEIQRAGMRARNLVRQLLAFGRKQALEYHLVDLNQVVTGFEKLLRRTIREDIELDIIPCAESYTVLADPGQMEQVLMNLAVNAADAMPKGGRLTIEVAAVDLDEEYARNHPEVEPGRFVRMAVSDTGCGMDQETRRQVFEPFFSTKGEQGTGLGLATVYGIAKQHGGHASVYSEPGKGSTFKIYLPLAEDVPRPETGANPPAQETRGTETILVVEDHEQVRKLARTILEHRGYTLLAAENGKEAMKILASRDEPVHLLLTDVVMPEMNGRELFLKAKEMRPGLKVLYMSGYTDNVIAHRGVLEKGIAFLQKPFTVEALTSKVREVLA